VLREQAWLIAAIALLAATVALLVGIGRDPTYEATATVAYEDPANQAAAFRGMRDPDVARNVKRALDSPASSGQLQDAVIPTPAPELLLIDLTATSEDPEFATQLANEYGDRLVAHVNREEQQQLLDQSDELLEQVEGIPESQAEQRAALQSEANRLRVESRNERPMRFFEAADEPQTEGAGRLLRNAALGLALGLIIGIALAFLRRAVDRRLHGGREVQTELGLPLLGYVSGAARSSLFRRRRRDGEEADLEAYRLLRKNIEVLREPPPRTILVTGPERETGASTVAGALARVQALVSRRTLLVDCDLRQPALEELLGLESGPGLADVLEGRAELSAVIRELDMNGEAASAGGDGAVPPAGRLACITAGERTSSHPAELLGSERFRDLLRAVSQSFDVTILDSSPLLSAVDTVELLPLAESVVVCIRSGSTTWEEALAAKSALTRFATAPAGIVVTGLRRTDERFAELGDYTAAEASSSSTVPR
jgi:receptor protein-tyrosine kinase